jgi:alkylation response protein AidB-like acyl-CoA dehydrogenase
MIREVAVKTAQRVVQPKATEMDATGEFPRELLDTLGRQGLLSVLLPEEFGGTNGDVFSFCLVIEEIAKVCGSSSLILLAQGAGTMPILIGGDASQQERYFNQIAEKNSLTALAMGDVDVAADVGPIEVEARKQGGDYLLRGRKGFVTNGSVADLYSVFAGSNVGSGQKGFSAFVVEKGTPGLRFGKREETIGMKGRSSRKSSSRIVGFRKGIDWAVMRRGMRLPGRRSTLSEQALELRPSGSPRGRSTLP